MGIIDDGRKCPNYSYTVTQILISVKCFFTSSVGFRCLSNLFHTLQEWIPLIAIPAYTTIRQWVLKIGLYKLTQPKNSLHGWFFIIDTSIQMGSQKCVVVLGVKKVDINQNFCPTLKEVVPLVVRPLHTCPGEIIDEILREATMITGKAPIAIISDAGGENRKGVRLFTKDYSDTVHLFDISHKINTCLKAELDQDKIWLAFRTNAAVSIQHLKLSAISYLVPPRQRSKERMHSAFPLIEWGLQALKFLDSEEANKLAKEDRIKIEWLRNYQFSLPCFMCFEELCKHALDLVHQKGYYLGVGNEFVIRTEYLCLKDKRVAYFRDKIKAILKEEEQKVPEGVQYLGSSEILESLFGKFKAKEGHHASSGLTSLVLAIPALVGQLDKNLVAEALGATSNLDVEQWVKNEMGQTFLSQRRSALGFSCKNDSENYLDVCDLYTE